jgi:S-adenosylmethionine synthetase
VDLALSSLPGEGEHEVEVVERKGTGHPDTMCDALAEAFANALARFYVDRFGSVAHFNVDKALLVGGASRPAFRGGEVTTPIQVYLAGRATREVRGVHVPVEELAIEAGRSWVREHMHALHPDRHVSWSCLVRGGASDLVGLFDARARDGGAAWLANDTSVGAGYAPLSRLERAVLAASARLAALARERPEVGEDTKVMGARRGERVDLTVACAMVCGSLTHLDDYAARCADIAREVGTAAEAAFGGPVRVVINAADDLPAGRAYLTVTGTSAEAGDDGQVGRGNRVNGLITPYRPMSLEAAAGKNPVSHVGKLYNVAAHRISAALVARVPAVVEAHCFMLSRIGHRVDDPPVVDVRIRTRDGVPVESLRAAVAETVRDGIVALGGLAAELVAGKVSLF